ncbi:MAG: hypothetical protein LBM60_03090 [Clostridium sp.]|jgi:hypothetical protein|nr:hypothetical protein [Clostridium sp.]
MIKQVFSVMVYNYRGWRKNIRVMLTFCLAFILCFLLSDKAVGFANEYGTSMQIVEAFVWMFGDSNSILLSSMLLMLLFADMPFISPATPFYLMRINRKTWMIGQAAYIISATFLYLVFIMTATSLVCMTQSFIGNMWSETAAILGYSNAGRRVALPALVKTLEKSTPYACMATIFLLMLFYSLFMVLLMLFFNIWKGQLAGVVSVFVFSVFGFLLDPQTIKVLFQLPDELLYQANVAVGWLSPLNQATYHMHNFGYDLLPRLWQTYAIFGGLIVTVFLLCLRAIRRYSFQFLGTEGS